MAWEWVAPTATAVVALGGIAATWMTARGARDSQERLQVAQRDETRQLTMRNEQRQAYAEFVGEVREWRIRSNLQGLFTPVVEKEALELRELVGQMLSDRGLDMTVDEALATPEVAAAVAAKRAGSVAHMAVMSPERAFLAISQIARLASVIRLIGGREVVAAVSQVQEALIVPFSRLLARSQADDEEQATLLEAVTLAEKAMANELRLVDAAQTD